MFITGGASGFGEALAIRYATAGHRVCIGDIHEQRGAAALAKIREAASRAGGRSSGPDAPLFVVCDVTSEAQMVAAAEALDERWGGVDVVINNAGVAAAGAIDQVSEDDWTWIVNINLLGVARGCRVFAPRLTRQGSGTIVNVSSMAGLIHPPTMAPYNATKAAVVALSETLSVELASDKIDVTVVCPSFFRTNLTESMRAARPELKQVTHKLMDRANASADVIADRIFEGATRRQFRVVPHADAKFAWMLKRLSPFSVYAKAIGLESKRMMGNKAPS